MLSSRTKTIAIAIAFISEYTSYRETSWNSAKQQATLWASWIVSFPDPSIRRNACAEIKKSIHTADAPEKLIRIIYQIATLARETQAVQSTAKDSYVLGLFTADNSLFAKVLHATRTRLVSILKTDYTVEYEQEITRLKNDLEKKEKLLIVDLKKKLNVSKLKEERNIIYSQLLDLQDSFTIEDACKNDKFPNSLPLMPRDLEVDPNVPVVYLDHYYHIYYKTNISSDLKRAAFFREEVTKLMHPKNNLDNKTQDILDDLLEEDDFSSMYLETEKTKTISANSLYNDNELHQSQQEQQLSDQQILEGDDNESNSPSRRTSFGSLTPHVNIELTESRDISQQMIQEEKPGYHLGRWK